MDIRDFYNDLSEVGKEYCDHMHDLFLDFKSLDEKEMETILLFFLDYNRKKKNEMEDFE